MEKVDTKPHELTTRCFWPPVGLGVSAENSLRLHPPSTFWIQLDLETLKTRSSWTWARRVPKGREKKRWIRS